MENNDLYSKKKLYTLYINYLYYKIDFVFYLYSITHTNTQTTPNFTSYQLFKFTNSTSLPTL